MLKRKDMSKKPFNKSLFRNNDLKIPFAIAAIHQNIIKTIINISVNVAIYLLFPICLTDFCYFLENGFPFEYFCCCL